METKPLLNGKNKQLNKHRKPVNVPINTCRVFTEGVRKQMVRDLMAAGLFEEDAELQANKYFGSILLRNPPRIAKDISTIKARLFTLGEALGISVTQQDLDNAHIYCREIYFHFGRLHLKQTIEATYCDEGELESLSKVYKRLTIQAKRERPLRNSRLMEPKIFACKLLPGLDCATSSAAETDETDEIYPMINKQFDTLLQSEEKLLGTSDLERVEEVLERLSGQYEESYLEHSSEAVLGVDLNVDKADLTPLDTLYDSPRECADHKKTSWKHVIKGYLMEKLLLMREYKRKIAHALNYFNSIKARLNQDRAELASNSSTQLNLEILYIAPDEIRFIDHDGAYIFLEPTLADLKDTMQRLINCGSYYIMQYESKFRFLKSKAMVDRGLVLLDLLKEETKFVYAKVRVLRKLMYVYEHACDWEKVQSVGQALHEFMERKPKLQLTSEYFSDAYQMECKCLANYSELLDKLIIGQINEELKIHNSHYKAMMKKRELKELYAVKQEGKAKAKEQSINDEIEVALHDPYRGRRGEAYNRKLEDIMEMKPKYEQELYIEHEATLKKDKELEELHNFTSFEEGVYTIFNTIPYNHSQDASLPPFDIGSLYASLADVVRVLAAIKKAARTITDHYEAESGFASVALEAEAIMEAMKTHEELLNSTTCEESIADSPEFLINAIKEVAKDFNHENLYETDPLLLTRLSPLRLNELDFASMRDYIRPKKSAQRNEWPSLLTLSCNLLEFIKLREQLLRYACETSELAKIYVRHQELVSNKSFPLMAEPVLSNKPLRSVCIEAAVCRECKLNYAVQEFDPELQNLLCFHNSKCIQLVAFTSGLEEIRAVLHYQMMQAQLLQIAIQGNHWMLLPYIRAFAESDLTLETARSKATRDSLSIPNSILGQGESKEEIRKVMMEMVAPCFIELQTIKSSNVPFIRKAYHGFLAKIQPLSRQATTRALKSYSLYLLHQYCDCTLKSFYSLSIYTHLFSVAKALRSLCALFPEDELLFDCSRSRGLELAVNSLGLSFAKGELHEEGFDIRKSILKIPSTEEIAGMIKLAQRHYVKCKEVNSDFDPTMPEAPVKDYLNSLKQAPRSKSFLKSDFVSPDDQGVKALTGLLLIRNIVILELSVELPHASLELWLQLIRNVRSNFFIWRNTKIRIILNTQ